MTSTPPTPQATTTSTTTLATATDTPPTVSAAAPGPSTPRLWAQTHALRALADFLDRHGTDGLHLALSGDRIDIHLHPRPLTGVSWAGPDEPDDQARQLATALGATAHRTSTPSLSWDEAVGRLAGHPIHVVAYLREPETTT